MTKEPTAPVRVLIVEDEVIIAMEIQLRLENAGFDVCGIAATGEKAILAAREKSPDVVLMDITLRGPMDGLEAAERIRAERNTAIVFLSASENESVLRRIREFTRGRHIPKPFDERDLIAAVRRAAGGAGSPAETEGKGEAR
ncbi:MAG: response regulator [Candidatus Aminicenantes bacterium]|nr:response regulator [Candidatus Aminicenantes bacterium]